MGSKNTLEQSLAKFQRSFEPGEYVYKQGTMGNTMFIVLSGTIHLVRNSRGSDRIIATVSTGEVLGEKALIKKSPYRHSLSAVVTSSAECLEFTAADFLMVQKQLPDFSTKVIRVLSERLDEANELISILQSNKEVERVVDYLLFFSKYHSKKIPQGFELTLSSHDMAYAINMSEERVKELLSQLVQTRALILKEGSYIIHDTTLLEQQISDMKEAA